MRILFGCEESQAGTIAFRKRGYEAYSCDWLPCSGGHPEWHIQGDVRGVMIPGLYDFTVSFPPCTDLAVSGARWFDKKRLSGEQEQSISFFLACYNNSDVTENPIGIMDGGKYLKKWFPFWYDMARDLGLFTNRKQIIQPWQFGHGETKATVLHYRNNEIPLLKPTNVVGGREQRVWKLPPTKDRAILRSKSYDGIMDAMADQWGPFIKKSP